MCLDRRSIRKPVKFNPAESETYRAIQEEQLGDVIQEVAVPPQTKVFSPSKNVAPKVNKAC